MVHPKLEERIQDYIVETIDEKSVIVVIPEKKLLIGDKQGIFDDKIECYCGEHKSLYGLITEYHETPEGSQRDSHMIEDVVVCAKVDRTEKINTLVITEIDEPNQYKQICAAWVSEKALIRFKAKNIIKHGTPYPFPYMDQQEQLQ